MTERLGSTAGWRTAAVVAPAAAAALALATGWALQHPPATAASSPAAPAAPAGPADEAPFGSDHSDLTLQQRALAERARVVRLTQRLRKVQARTTAERSAPVGAVSSGGTGYLSTAGGGSVSVAAPPAPVARAATPAPATHTSTGASGAKK
jgi:hypothetical protein